MRHLHQEIAKRVTAWRTKDFACSEYPAIAEIFDWAHVPDAVTADQLRDAKIFVEEASMKDPATAFEVIKLASQT
ncbi:MAG: hypothetical protein L0H94_14695 [Nitrospira sp.]|nr:hypothetical protein [Nitrospira sp.]